MARYHCQCKSESVNAHHSLTQFLHLQFNTVITRKNPLVKELNNPQPDITANVEVNL